MTAYAPTIPEVTPYATLEEIRAATIALREYVGTREPEQEGDPLDKVVIWRDVVASGLAIYALGTPGGTGPGGGIFTPPPADGLSGWDDLTPPDPLDNLVVTSIPTGFFVEFDAPIYGQGGGNAYSIIYQANWDGVSPLPTFGDAVEVGRTTERGVILVIAAEPGVQGHFWAQPVSHAEDYNNLAPQTTPTGGTNGVSAVAGQLSDDHIANLSAGKLTAGSIGVSEYIQSTGFVSGSFGWKIEGNGDAEFSDVIVRGTIYATAGLIGGAVIDADGVESDNYVAGTSGWRLDNDTGTLLAYSGEFGGDLVAANGTLGDLEIEGSIFSGKTSYADTTAGFWLGIDSSVAKWHIGDADWWMKWTGTALEMRTKSALGFPVGESLLYERIMDAHALDSTDGNAYIRFNSDGTIDKKTDTGSYTNIGNWYLPTTTGIGSSYEIRVLPTGDTLDTGASDTKRRVALSSALTYHINAPWTSGNNSKSTALTFEIFANAGTSALGMGSCDLYVEYAA